MYVKVGEEIKIRVCRMREKNAGQNLNGYTSTVEDLCKRHPGQGILCGVKLAKTGINFLKNEL